MPHLTYLQRPRRHVRERVEFENLGIHDLRHSFSTPAQLGKTEQKTADRI